MTRITASLTILFALSPAALATPWDPSNDPSRFGGPYEMRMEALPLHGSSDPTRIPWSETYWPSNEGSINIRWNAAGRPGFGLKSPTLEELKLMGPAAIAQLSPTEKFDIYRGSYDYPLKKLVASTDARPRAPDWAGICDGWSVAAIEYREPRAVTRVNPDGIVIPFGASDVKGLLSYTAARQKLDSIVIGRYCPFGIRLGFPNCRDLNPGSYHVILANELGIKRQAFPADIEPGREIWNQPVIGYEFEILGSAVSTDAPKALHIRAKLHYVDELEHPRFDPVTGTAEWRSDVQVSEYILELDSQSRITGGDWLTKYRHPDVFWRPTRPIQFTGEFERLLEIYEPVE
jgi:hypothetical protein